MTTKFKIYRLSTGGFFLGHELELCKHYCNVNGCTYTVDYITVT
jgi:hypothetical protein